MKTNSLNKGIQIAPADLENLISTLDVKFVGLAHCSVSTGYRLELGDVGAPGIHYNLSGKGKIIIENHPPIELKPHTLIIVPKKTPFRIEVADEKERSAVLKPIDGRLQRNSTDGVQRYVAGNGQPEVVLLCGYFHASYGASADLFASLSSPIVEQFEINDHIDTKLQAALSELMSQEIGSGAMSAALLKQVIVSILRRSLVSLELWIERFSILSDARISKAFCEMVAVPGSNHTVMSLADCACMSRSAFMSRFTELFGKSPMALLRELRMRQATQHLKTSNMSVDQIAHLAGYDSRGSFVKAFRKTYDSDPSTFRNSIQV